MALLAPYMILCAIHAIKFLADPWFTDRVLNCSHSMWNPRLYDHELKHLISPLWGDTLSVTFIRTINASFLWDGCLGGTLLSLSLLIPSDASSSISVLIHGSIILIVTSFFYFLTAVSYGIYTSQMELVIRSLVILCWGEVATIYSVFGGRWNDDFRMELYNNDHQSPSYATTFYFANTVLLLMEALVIVAMHTNRPKCIVSIERYHLIKNHFIENGMSWDPSEIYPTGYSDSRLLLSV